MISLISICVLFAEKNKIKIIYIYIYIYIILIFFLYIIYINWVIQKDRKNINILNWGVIKNILILHFIAALNEKAWTPMPLVFSF